MKESVTYRLESDPFRSIEVSLQAVERADRLFRAFDSGRDVLDDLRFSLRPAERRVLESLAAGAVPYGEARDFVVLTNASRSLRLKNRYAIKREADSLAQSMGLR